MNERDDRDGRKCIAVRILKERYEKFGSRGGRSLDG
jgi:hypothetical protein